MNYNSYLADDLEIYKHMILEMEILETYLADIITVRYFDTHDNVSKEINGHLSEVERFEGISIKKTDGTEVSLPFNSSHTNIEYILTPDGKTFYFNYGIGETIKNALRFDISKERTTSYYELLTFGNIVFDAKHSAKTFNARNFQSSLGRVYFLDYLAQLYPSIDPYPKGKIPNIIDDPEAFKFRYTA